MASVIADLHVLTACEAVARGRGDMARAAFVTWLVAQAQGWQAARQRLSKSSFYRHLAVLRDAGFAVPGDSQPPPSSSSVRELDSGAGLLRMVGQRFQLVTAFDTWTPAGSRGTVQQILFRNCEWLVGVQFDGSPGSYEELCVGRFARIAEWMDDSGT